jgi:hypothetical protein
MACGAESSLGRPIEERRNASVNPGASRVLQCQSPLIQTLAVKFRNAAAYTMGSTINAGIDCQSNSL